MIPLCQRVPNRSFACLGFAEAADSGSDWWPVESPLDQADSLELMGRIAGHYEWDNDDLRPGRKSEGGLHQNLFDSDGALQGSARCVPDEKSEGEPLGITECIYVPVVCRGR